MNPALNGKTFHDLAEKYSYKKISFVTAELSETDF